MIDKFIKSSAIIFGGYIYQNLIGLEVLCDWLDDPGRFEWVKLEADEDQIPRGLDDIVALRSDGSYVILQVKFTVDPLDENNQLNWEWLLNHKPNGTSLLQKWSRGLFSLGLKSISEAALITNRRPDREFLSCFGENQIQVELSQVPEEIKKQIIVQIGSEADSINFFDHFEFRHSHQGYLSLSRTLLDRYVPRHSTFYGWHVLFVESVNWAIRKNFPYPDGRITISLLRGTLDSRRPEPISQSFNIPETYSPPDESFTEDFLNAIAKGEKRITVLWGSPGQGKSTFLSYLCSRMEKIGIPYIRHHYFLNLFDTADRFSLPQVANSLMAQMEEHQIEYVQGLDNRPEKLREWIEACASGYAQQGERFVIIIDGLDHVWRENEHNRQPLDSLFRYLLPVAANATLVIGTQRVDEKQLPVQFSKFVEPENWIELPRMSLTAIRNWIEGQLKANRFELPAPIPHGDPLTELAIVFYDLSAGHPLHLTFSFEAVAREKRVVTPDLLKDLPRCPEGDIKKYYFTLWKTLSFQSKDALHLIAYVGFTWPPFGLQDCLGAKPGELEGEIGHLFYLTEVGYIPFHGSIVAFIREDIEEHQDRINGLLPSVVNWLETKAPQCLRWGWLWIYTARTGQIDEIINSPCRTWVIESLAKAYPKDQIAEILSEAEKYALNTRQFARAVRLRWLKVRLLNGTDFQIDDYSRVYACALRLSDDDYPIRNLSANSLTASIRDLHLLAVQFSSIGRKKDVEICQEQIRRRINDRIKARALDDRSLERASEKFLKLAAETGSYDPKKLLQSIRGFGTIAGRLFLFLINEISKHEDLRPLMVFLPLSLLDEMRKDLELALVRVAGLIQADLHEWAEFNELRNHPIIECWAHLYATSRALDIRFDLEARSLDVSIHRQEFGDEIEHYLHGLFFHIVAKHLELHGATPVFRLPEFTERPWLNVAVRHIVDFAASVGRLLSRGEAPGFGHLYRMARSVERPKDYDKFREYKCFRNALLDISTDLFLLATKRSRLREIPTREWREVVKSDHFLFSQWLNNYIRKGQRIVCSEDIKTVLEEKLIEESSRISPFAERTQTYLELCELAIFQQFESLGHTLLTRTLECVVGYGSHKDGSLANALNAIEAVAPQDPAFARTALGKLCPAISVIDEITDGDDVNYFKFVLARQLINLMPKSYVAYHEHLLKIAEWYEAEEVLSRLLQITPTDSHFMSFLTIGLWTSTTITPLRERADNGDRASELLILSNAKQFGQEPDDFGKERFSSSSTTAEENTFDFKAFFPEALPEMLRELGTHKIYIGARDIIKRWFEYWKEQKQGVDLLRAIETFVSSGNVPTDVAEVLDDAFELSLSLEGKDKAYRWIVAAQIYKHGWDSHYYSRDDALNRFQKFAARYANRWEEFIIDTSKSAYTFSTERIVIPHDRLVDFLMCVGKFDVARDVSEQIISTILEEVSDQPLIMPEWFGED